ncbi:ATP-binding protein [Rapidithrix thailandica]|uniref:ATP-binding protein n=1 Tax=Rapidithrix thailandica TaxID=413964 RepID=A0AAW9SHT0_9BACT
MTKTTMNRFDHYLPRLEQKGKELFGKAFRIYPEDRRLVSHLLAYFLKSKVPQGLDLHKGILLTGPIGCGKTCLMSLLRFTLPEKERFVLKPTRRIAMEFSSGGFPVIEKYSYGSFHSGPPALQAKAYCFDDLGLEPPVRHFGNELNIMAEVLLGRYELFVNQGMLTHATTNLSARELEAFYGNRVRSRLRSMMNLVSFGQEAVDKRK